MSELLQRFREAGRTGNPWRPLAFWGKHMDVNSFYGRDAASLMELPDNPQAGGALNLGYERYGMTLFSFDKPGVYRIQGTYMVKPRGGEGPRVWTGKLQSNPVFVRVTAKAMVGPLLPAAS